MKKLFILFLVAIMSFAVLLMPIPQAKSIGLVQTVDAAESSDPFEIRYGFWPYWIDASTYEPDWNCLTHVSYFSADANPDGTLDTTQLGSNYGHVRDTAHSRGVKVTLTVTTHDHNKMDYDHILAYSRDDFAANILQKIQIYDADGVCLDFEGVNNNNFYTGESNKVLMEQLIETLHDTLKTADSTYHISFCVQGWTEEVYRNSDLSGLIDAVFLMGYDYHIGGYSADPSQTWAHYTGPNSPYNDPLSDDVKDAVERLDNYYPTHKIILGVPFYGWDWESTSSESYCERLPSDGTSVTMVDAIPNAETYGRLWDSRSNTPWYRYQTGGVWHQCWYDDEESIETKHVYVKSNNLAGIGFWALGYEGNDADMWDVIGARALKGTWGKSQNVAVIDDYYGSAVGYLRPSDYPEQTFSTLSASQVSAATLANYDTVILFMFNPSGLTAAKKTAINDWIHGGGKLIIWDSDQVPRGSPWDYTWLPYPFSTSVPGQTGQRGNGLSILEENQLSSSDPSSPYYINTAVLNSQTDAVGDANVLISYSPSWHIDMMAKNVLGETGPSHVYADYGSGLIIYCALDWDYASSTSGSWLRKLLRQELQCSYLPFAAPTVPEEVGLNVQITADAPEGYFADKTVYFQVAVKNPTDLTGTNLVARNVGLTVLFAPDEIEITGLIEGQSGVDIAPGETKTTSFSGKLKKISENIDIQVNAIGNTNIGPIGGSGTCRLNAHTTETPDWSFALITDLHIGYNYQPRELDTDGKNEIDYDGRGWDDSELLTQESNYWLSDRLGSVVDTIITARNYYNLKFVVVLGDISDTAEKSEFVKARDILNRLNDYGICYIPIVGNHDIWPYTQEGAPDDRGQPHDTIATYAKGDEFFRDVFWEDSESSVNIGLIADLFGDSWRSQHSTPASLPGCDYSSYLQNYGFSYGEEGAKIDFLGLDIAPRYHQPMIKFWQTLEPDPYPGAATGGLAKIHQQTLDFENDFVNNYKQGNTVVVLAHYPLYPPAGGCVFPNNPGKILDPLAEEYGSIYDFGGHVHRNSEDAGLVTEYQTGGVDVQVRETEAVARETDCLLRTLSEKCIRIVKVKDGTLDCSTILKPMKKVDIMWPWANFAYSYASYPIPNKQMTFSACFTTFCGFKTTFDWNFDDGGYASGSSVIHMYTQGGTYNVTLTITSRNLVTGEVRIMTITRPVYVHAKHVISPVPTYLDATSLLTGEDLTMTPKNEYQLVLITRNFQTEDILIAGLAIHFENALGDIDLSTVVANADLEQAKSILYMPSWPEEVEQYKSLLIPSTGKGTVYLCLGATSLEEVTLENADLILNVGETKDGITATTAFYNGREYYLIYGATGTGGGELKDSIPPQTTLTIGYPKYIDTGGNVYVNSDTPFTLSAEDNLGGTGIAFTKYKVYNSTYDSGWIVSIPSIEFRLNDFSDGTYFINYTSTDNAGNIESAQEISITLDDSGPLIAIENPPAGWALQDGVTFIASASDSSGTRGLNFSIREANGDQGIPVGFEDIPATFDALTGRWNWYFNTLQLPDGYYTVLVNAEDNLGHTSSITVQYSIRNWAVLERLPSTPNSKAGRTMPVKFALRVAASVDPTQPFVYNEELTIKIYATDKPSNILQTSTFGETSRDYRIDIPSEKYITNFKTLSTPATYVVDIYRKDMLIGSFQFCTVFSKIQQYLAAE